LFDEEGRQKCRPFLLCSPTQIIASIEGPEVVARILAHLEAMPLCDSIAGTLEAVSRTGLV
jgi:hypothetical protein